MDIIEILIKFGSGVVSSMLETSKRYSNDERFTLEGREYYRELYEGLSIASNNLQDYQEERKSRKSSAYEKLDIGVSQKMRLNSCQNNIDALKVHTLAEIYFGRFRETSYTYFFGEEPTCEKKNWVDDWELRVSCLKESYRVRYNGESFTPVLVFKGVLICEEGIGRCFDVNDETHAYFPIPYKDIISIRKVIKRNFLFSDECIVWFECGNKAYCVVDNTWKFDYDTAHRAETDLFVRAITDFIHCLNPNCAIQEKN